MQDLYEVEPIEFWRVLHPYTRYDQQMPSILRKKLLDIEMCQLSHLAWRHNSSINQLLQSNEIDKENQENQIPGPKLLKAELIPPLEMFLDRVLRHTATQLNNLARGLNIHDDLIEYSWTTLKYILSQESKMLTNRFLETLIFCTIYSVCKIFKFDIKFQEILQKFQELQLANKNMFNEIVYQVPLDNGETKDIIEFYNVCFIVKLRKFFKELPKNSPDAFFSNINAPSTTNSNEFNGIPNTDPRNLSNKTKPVESVKTNKFGKKTLFPTDIQQSPLNKLQSSPFVANVGIGGNHPSGKNSAGSPGNNSNTVHSFSGSNKNMFDMKYPTSNMMTMVSKQSPSFFTNDIITEGAYKQSGSSKGNRIMSNHPIRGTINSKKIINFDDCVRSQCAEDSLDTTPAPQSKQVHQQNVLQQANANKQATFSGESQKSKNKFDKENNEQILLKKFAMLIPSNNTRNTVQPRPNISHESPPTYAKFFSNNNDQIHGNKNDKFDYNQIKEKLQP